MKYASVLLLLAIAAGSAWGEGGREQVGHPRPSGIHGSVVVYAAASLTQAFTVIGDEFMKRHPGTKVLLNFAGSQQLSQQLALGASADVFASADSNQMKRAEDHGRIGPGAPRIFAHNRLIVVVARNTSAPVRGLADLARRGLKIVLAAQPVPVGRYSRIFLDKAAADPAYGAAFRDGVTANIVSLEENVRAVLNKVILGEADAGIVYSSDLSAKSAAEVTTIPIPDALNTIASYPIAPVADSTNPRAAAAFVDLVLSAYGQKVLADYGFVPAHPAGIAAK
ncbi:MAG TPA: molybdate ABC transporter substrate-binding protein [Spirochaetia bacterium]|nr:molybdate ABC transporter substrate-binding protein [Spirochaetia bacterium]